MYSGRMREWIGKLFQTSPAWNYKMSEMFLDSRLHETSLNIIEITSPFHLVWNSPPTLAVTQCIWNKQIPMCEKILAHGCGIERMMAAAGGCLQFSLTISVKISTLIAATHRIHQPNVGKYTSPMDSMGKKLFELVFFLLLHYHIAIEKKPLNMPSVQYQINRNIAKQKVRPSYAKNSKGAKG